MQDLTQAKKEIAQKIGESDEEYEYFSDYFSLGQKKLLPPRVTRQFDLIESRSRSCLEAHSFSTVWGRFVPCTAYPAFKERISGLREEYFAAGDEFLTKLEEVKEEVAEIYTKAAKVAYKRLNSLKDSSSNEVKEETAEGFALRDNTAIEVPDDFLENFLSKILSFIPAAEQIKESFQFDYYPFFIPLPSLLEADMQKVETLRQERELEKQMNKEVAEKYLNEKTELIDGFLADVQKQLRGLVYETSVNVLQSIQKNDGKLIGRSALQLTNLVDKVNQLNFYGDEEIESQIAAVRAQLDNKVKDRDVTEIQGALKELASTTRITLLDLGETPRLAREVGVEDVTEEEMLRQTRLSEVEDVPELKLQRRVRLALERSEGIEADEQLAAT